MSNSSMTWKFLFPCCVNPNKSKSKFKSKLESKKIVPTCLQRLLISDISNPDWEFSIQELSTSLIGSNLHVFTLDELRVITSNFSYTSNFIGEGGFGAVYKGFIDGNFRPGLKSQSVAVKILDLEGPQGHKEWLTEVIFLGQMRHKHLVKLIGYCCENEQRVLVYEYMARGNLDNQLFRRSSAALPWLTRMKIALGAAKGLAFLHEADRSVIFRDFKAANILLDHDFNAKLSDFGFARDGPEDDESHITTEHILGTQGYVAPEYAMTGHLTIMSDVYSFGVVLLELLTGRRSMDKNRPKRAHSLAEWARPFLKDHRKLDMIIDPRFEGHYSTQGVKIAAMLAHQCLSHHPKSRPNMTTVVRTLEPLLNMDDISTHFVYVVPKADKKDHFVNSTEENKKNGDRLRHNALHMKLNNGRDSSRFHR